MVKAFVACVASFLVSMFLGMQLREGRNVSVPLGSTESLRFVGFPGQTVGFHLKGRSINALWASTGLTILLDDRSSIPVSGCTAAKSWDDTLHYLGRPEQQAPVEKDFAPVCRFTVPSTTAGARPPTTLRATLTGSVTLPRVSGGGFVNDNVHVELPIVLEMVSPEQAAAIRSRREAPLRVGLWLSLGLLLLSFVAYLRTLMRRHGVRAKLDDAASSGLIVLLILLVFGFLFGLESLEWLH